MTIELSSRRRLLLLVVFPVSVLSIMIPLAPHLVPQSLLAFRDPQQIAAANPNFYDGMDDGIAPRINASADIAVQKMHRTVALDIIERLENEASQKNGTSRLTPLDLKRLRNALQ